MIFLGISVVLNIGGDLFFLKVIPMGVRGAAVATVLSQFIALIACLVYSLKRYDILWISRKDSRLMPVCVENLCQQAVPWAL